MDMSPEQIKEIKKQVIQQIENTFPEDKKKESVEKINSMDDSQFIQFLKQNGMIKDSDSSSGEDNSGQQCVFCSIISGELPSTKIDEDGSSIAILELNPLSEGHVLVIPKKHGEEISEESNKFASKIRDKIKSSLNPKEVLIEPGSLFGHGILNVIPIYGDSVPSERKKSSPGELTKIKEKIDSAKVSEDKDSGINSEEENSEEENSEEEIKIIPKRIP